MAQKKQMALGALIEGWGIHPAAWMHPETVAGSMTNFDYWKDIVQAAERAKFDLYFIADTPAARTTNLDAYSRYPLYMNCFEPVTMLAALAQVTSHIGLGATISTSFTEPFNVARQMASIDHLSKGRAAWNVVTSANDFAARNFGLDKLPPPSERYARANEHVEIVTAYWDTWEEDAFIHDKKQGLSYDPAKMHIVDYEGKYFKVHGALNIARAPQGRPVIIQAGASGEGKDLAAKVGEIIFGTGATLEDAKAYYDDVKGRAVKFGRDRDDIKILSGVSVCVGKTHQEAVDRYAHMQELVHPNVGKTLMGWILETDLSHLDYDGPIPMEILPAKANLHQMYFAHALAAIKAEPKITIRQLYNKTLWGGMPTLCGSPTEIADLFQERFEKESCDGFMILFPAKPTFYPEFLETVVPELQRRGIFKTEYAGTTLRENLGLKKPAHRIHPPVRRQPAMEPRAAAQ